MVIDVHAHIAWHKLYDSQFLEGLLERFTPSNSSVSKLTESKVKKILYGLLSDANCENLERQMTAAGVSQTVLLNVPNPERRQHAHPTTQFAFEHHKRVLERHPDRFLLFAGVAPYQSASDFEQFKTGVAQGTFRGIKLYAPLGYSVEDSRLDCYYRVCSDNGITVLTHTGPSMRTLNSGFSEPRHVESITVKWPQINFILAHAGFQMDADAVRMAQTYDNLFLDIAGFQSTYTQVDDQTLVEFGEIFNNTLNEKVLFGTDWPMFNLLTPIRNNVEFIQNLFANSNYSKYPDRLHNVLYRNAQRALRLTE